MHLPEIADELMNKGFIVRIADDHQKISVSLKNRNVSITEIEQALHWNINHAVRFSRYNGSVIITE